MTYLTPTEQRIYALLLPGEPVPVDPYQQSPEYRNANGWEVSWHNGRWYVHHDSGRTIGAFPTAREAFDAGSRAMMERQR